MSTVARAATPIPSELVGIWTTHGAELKGEAIWNGSAVYLDADGVGGLVGGDGREVLGVRFVVTSYDAGTRRLNIDLTESGKVIASEVLVYDPAEQVIFLAKDAKTRYYRHAKTVSAEIRKSLGLEPRAN
jgi:hypothetical protein